MEICTMDKPTSHFYKGIGPNDRSSLNGYADDNYSVPFASTNHHHQQQPQSTCSVNMNVQYQESWRAEDIECKQESEAMPVDSYLDNTNDYDHYTDRFNYGYTNSNSTSSSTQPFYPSEEPSQRSRSLYRNGGSSNPATYSPYQISASAKSQLPAWYAPPQTHPMHPHPFAPPPPHPSYYQQQQPSSSSSSSSTGNFYPYQASYAASSTATSGDHNMRNMIQMTNR
jgi:hypothetical protein